MLRHREAAGAAVIAEIHLRVAAVASRVSSESSGEQKGREGQTRRRRMLPPTLVSEDVVVY